MNHCALCSDVPRDGQGGWLPSLLQAIKSVLQVSSNADQSQLSARCTDWRKTSHAVQFTCAGLDVDIMVTADWNVTSEPVGYDALFEVTCKQKSVSSRQWSVESYKHLCPLISPCIRSWEVDQLLPYVIVLSQGLRSLKLQDKDIEAKHELK
jgi:hypothetical protein